MDDFYKLDKVLEQDLADGKLYTNDSETLEESLWQENENFDHTAVEHMVDTITDYSGVSILTDEIRDALASMRGVFYQVRFTARKNYFRNSWGYKPKRIPPKVAICSSRHKGRKCKKRK